MLIYFEFQNHNLEIEMYIHKYQGSGCIIQCLRYVAKDDNLLAGLITNNGQWIAVIPRA